MSVLHPVLIGLHGGSRLRHRKLTLLDTCFVWYRAKSIDIYYHTEMGLFSLFLFFLILQLENP